MVLEVKNPPANVGDIRDVRSSPDLGDPLEEAMAPHSGIRAENAMDRGAWQVPRAAESWTRLKRLSTYARALMLRTSKFLNADSVALTMTDFSF